jgi:hypothetical protein
MTAQKLLQASGGVAARAEDVMNPRHVSPNYEEAGTQWRQKLL